MILRLLVVLALLIQPVQAEQWTVKKPPAMFDHEPTRPYTLQYKSQNQVNRMCTDPLTAARKTNPKANALGCTDIPKRLIWVVKSLPKQTRKQVVRHEKAHLNGWFHS